MGSVPDQVPGFVTFSVWPSRVSPVRVGRTVLDGATPVTTADGPESATVAPSGFVAVTSTRTTKPMSAGTSLYVGAVAVSETQLVRPTSQRCHLRVVLIVGGPVHEPSV